MKLDKNDCMEENYKKAERVVKFGRGFRPAGGCHRVTMMMMMIMMFQGYRLKGAKQLGADGKA